MVDGVHPDSILEDDLRNRLFSGVRERQRNVSGAEFGSEFSGFAMKSDDRAAPGLATHFDVAPAHAMIPSCAKSFHGRFLGSEARRITFHAVGLRLTVAD